LTKILLADQNGLLWVIKFERIAAEQYIGVGMIVGVWEPSLAQFYFFFKK